MKGLAENTPVNMVHGLSPATPTSAATASWWCRKVLLLLVPKRFPANKLRLLSPPSPKTAAEALLATAQALTHTARHTPHPHRRPQTQLADHNIAKHMPERMKFIARCRVLIEIIQALKQNVGFYQRWENRGKTSSKTLRQETQADKLWQLPQSSVMAPACAVPVKPKTPAPAL